MIVQVAESGVFKSSQVTAMEAAQKVNLYEALTWLSYKADLANDLHSEQKRKK